MDKRVALANPAPPSAAIADGDGGFTESWTALIPATVWASVRPAPAREMERLFSNTIAAIATDIVTIRYHSGVTTKTRITFVDGRFVTHYLHVRGIQNPNRHDECLMLACEEVASEFAVFGNGDMTALAGAFAGVGVVA